MSITFLPHSPLKKIHFVPWLFVYLPDLSAVRVHHLGKVGGSVSCFFLGVIMLLSGVKCFGGCSIVSWWEKGGPAAFTLTRWPLFLHFLYLNIALSNQSINKYLLSAYYECSVLCRVLWRIFFKKQGVGRRREKQTCILGV